MPSGPPSRVITPDGWTLALGAKDESQVPGAATDHSGVVPGIPLKRDLRRLGERTRCCARRGLEVGYEIGCGIDMSTANGVTIANSLGAAPSLGRTDTGGNADGRQRRSADSSAHYAPTTA